MNYTIASYFHFIHTIFINTYFLWDIKIVPIWILHMSIIVLSWGFSNYTCPMTIVEQKLNKNNNKNKNVFGDISDLTLVTKYKILVISWFLSLILYGFNTLGMFYKGVSYVCILAKLLYLIQYTKYKTYFIDIDVSNLINFFYFYIVFLFSLISYMYHLLI